eukprot:924492-Amphidinium_carterae.1
MVDNGQDGIGDRPRGAVHIAKPQVARDALSQNVKPQAFHSPTSLRMSDQSKSQSQPRYKANHRCYRYSATKLQTSCMSSNQWQELENVAETGPSAGEELLRQALKSQVGW